MKRHLGIVPIMAIVLQASSFAAEPLSPSQVLGKKEVCISDGSSLYIFSPDGKFRLEPVGLSGRTIEGTWKLDSVTLHITGTWGWINGLSKEGDFREMDIHIGYLRETGTEKSSYLTGLKHTLYDGYFLIERLESKRPEP